LGKGQETQTLCQNVGWMKGVYNLLMAKDVIHISEAEAASDFAALTILSGESSNK